MMISKKSYENISTPWTTLLLIALSEGIGIIFCEVYSSQKTLNQSLLGIINDDLLPQFASYAMSSQKHTLILRNSF